jgi:hypothetical protein
MPMSLFGFAERQTDRNLTWHRAEHISSRRQHPVTADSPDGTSFSRMSPEVSCSGEIEVFPARLIVGPAARARTRPHATGAAVFLANCRDM